MKIFEKQIKVLLLSLVMILSLNLYAQKRTTPKKVFLRVYNLEGKKMSKGNIVFINDSIIGLNKSGNQEKISYKDISSVKTKRSAGHNVLVGSLVGSALFAIIGGASSEEETKTRNVPIIGEYQYKTGTSPGTGAAIGGGAGLIGGAAIGGITSTFKNSESHIIDGDIQKWRIFKEMIEKVRFR